MPFVSYAQNFEDVMLWRVLKHIEIGFYIDVGANDPENHSVTKAFYDRGWRGMNIEPVPQWIERLREARPRDINLQIAASKENGEILLYELTDTGLSTSDIATAERHELEGGYKKEAHRVPTETLTSLCQRYHVAPIHFLKIDVEGAEKDVLSGLDLSTIRPWVILVESTLPLSQVENYGEWESLLLKEEYEFVYFDGLNRYYVAREHGDLSKYFLIPPNVFDGFITHAQHSREIRVQELEERARSMEVHGQQLEEIARSLEVQVQQLELRKQEAEANSNEWHFIAESLQRRLQSIYSSYSWRLTTPFRVAQRLLTGDRTVVREVGDTVKKAIRLILRPVVYLAMRIILKFSNLRSSVESILQEYPNLHQEYLWFVQHYRLVPVESPVTTTEIVQIEELIQPIEPILPTPSLAAKREEVDRTNLSPRVRSAYDQLQASVNKNAEGR